MKIRSYKKSPSRRGAGLKRTVAAILMVTLLVVGYIIWRKDDSNASGVNIETAPKTQVKRGDLTVTVLQAGDLNAKNSKVITNETETNAQILEIVEDGQRVQKGDLLVKLDVSELQDRILTEQNKVANAEASYQQAKEQLAIKDLQHETDLDSAILRVDLAKLDIKKYEEAEYPQDVRKAQMNITLAEEELNRAKTKLTDTRTLVEKGFTNRQELETAELEVQRKEVDLLNKKEDLRILKEYTHEKDLKKLKNEQRKAEADLEKIKKTYKTERASTLVNLESRQTNLEIARNQLNRITERLDKAEVYSEYEGLVFYAASRHRWSNDPEVQVGSTMRRQQEILEFPDLSAWKVGVGVPESLIDQVEVGQKALVTIDAIPGAVIKAEVFKISVVPNRAAWWDPNSKVYTVDLDVTEYGDLFLKPGMSAMVEIITEERENVLQVPLQSVRTEGDKQFVYLVKGKKPVKTSVEVGVFNDVNIEIISGVNESDTVLMYAPAATDTSITKDKRPIEAQKNKKNNQQNKKDRSNRTNQDQGDESDKQTPKKREGGGGSKAANDAKKKNAKD
jgi:HlyD family secretion protein